MLSYQYSEGMKPQTYVPKAAQEVNDEVYGALSGLVSAHVHNQRLHKVETCIRTGSFGRRGSTALSSRRACGSRNSLNLNYIKHRCISQTSKHLDAVNTPFASNSAGSGASIFGFKTPCSNASTLIIQQTCWNFAEVLTRARPNEDLLNGAGCDTG